MTIGVPVFNGADTLHRAVESALAQTQPEIAVHVSDNASTDATPQVAQDLAARHARVRYTRHPSGIGISGNFGFLLREARTEYFMWLAADDCIKPTYVERTLAALDRDPGLVACTTQGLFVHADGAERPVAGAYPLLADPVANLAAYLSHPFDNTRIFGLYRTWALQRAFPPRHFHGYDWAIAAGTLLHGKHMQIPETLMLRDETPWASYITGIRRDSPTTLGRVLPVLPMTIDLVRRQRIPLRWPVVKALLKLNLEMHANYLGYHHHRYQKVVTRLLQRHVLWRLTTPPAPAASQPSGRAAEGEPGARTPPA